MATPAHDRPGEPALVGVDAAVYQLLTPERLARDAHALLAALPADRSSDPARGVRTTEPGTEAVIAVLRQQRRALLAELADGLLGDARDGDRPSYDVGSFRDAGE